MRCMDIPQTAQEFGDRLAVLEAAQDSYRVAVWEDEDGPYRCQMPRP